MKIKRFIILVVIFGSIFAGFKIYRHREEQRMLEEIYALRDGFFCAVVDRDFDELERVLTIDTYFEGQRRSYEELRDQIRESFENIEYTVGEISYNDLLTYYNLRVSKIFFFIHIDDDGFGRKYSSMWTMRIEKNCYGTYEITRIGFDSDDEFAQLIFGDSGKRTVDESK